MFDLAFLKSKGTDKKILSSVENKVGIAAVGDSHRVMQTVVATSSTSGSPEQILKIAEAQAQIGGGGGILKKETLGKKGFSVQDKVNSSCPFPSILGTYQLDWIFSHHLAEGLDWQHCSSASLEYQWILGKI